MQTEQPKKHKQFSEYNFSLKVILLLVSIEVLILVCISFVKIYIDKKQNLIDRMRDEIEIVEKIFVDDTDYSTHVINQLAELVKMDYQNNQKIDDIIHHYTPDLKYKKFFGWHAFYWIDKDNIIRNSSGNTIYNVGSNLNYLANIKLAKLNPGKVIYSPHPFHRDNFTTLLDLSLGVTNDNGELIGVLMLQIDTSTLLENLELYRRKTSTEFAIVDSRMNIIMSYPINGDAIGINGLTISNQFLLDTLAQLSFTSKDPKEVHHLKMFSGENFFVKKIKNKPYALIVSINHDEIKSNFTKRIGLKFLEIAILASFFLGIVLMIYKRETWLRAKAEKASHLATKAMVAKSEFLSYTAHEIRSPLGFILTGSEIMAKKLFGPIPKQYEDYVTGIHHNAKLILEFINDILDEKHVASGNFKMEETICDLKEIIEKAVKTNQTRFHERKIEINASFEDNLPLILGDNRKLLQVMNNLISNAYKYSLDNTKISVNVKLAAKKLKIIISDQGIGMTEDDIKLALTKQGKVHDQKPGNFIESHGLGLPIVLMLVKAHDGVLDIKSKVNIGTTVTITLPERRIMEKSKEREQ